ncbi:MAG: hypothetical protein M1814_004846 [Vezdaea aestivalis]|nr:MAG: hypothetical protein M1814_004846 [Vezdaea aestivalis]
MEIAYREVNSIITGSPENPTITFALFQAPKIVVLNSEVPKRLINSNLDLDDLIAELSQSSLGPGHAPPKRKRVLGINAQHESVISGCLVYRFVLHNGSDIRRASFLEDEPHFPSSMSYDTQSKISDMGFRKELKQLSRSLAAATQLKFPVQFQMQRLAQNGFLSPKRVQSLIPVMVEVVSRSGSRGQKIAASALSSLHRSLGYPGPDTTEAKLSLPHLTKLIYDFEKSITWDFDNWKAYQEEEHEGMAWFHRAIVTPAGVYLDGPNLETKNRVIRKYPNHENHFLRVIFCDEDWEPCLFDYDVSNDAVYDGRYSDTLNGSIDIAGLSFQFLGFSHSSLRARSCWFMAPFVEKAQIQMARQVIRGLGDFSSIRSPARCAARIGQAFSDTVTSIELPSQAQKNLDDVSRNGSVFSDGVGTISMVVLDKILAQLNPNSQRKANIFQIRYAGAKGVVSYDSNLKGEQICLRPSMIKFASKDSNLEICQGAKLLPLYLNRQYIKILEDLGVKESIFLRMQEHEVNLLRSSASSPEKAATFLMRQSVGNAARFPYLLRKLAQHGFSFKDDEFLFTAVEIRILIQLRQVKYRSRIPVEQGCTLFGIMDETNFLQDGEVYCTWRTHKGQKTVVRGRVLVARSPALHPGDVQAAHAVAVPENSPLKVLDDCIVFSQQGSRSFCSQLAGGDLDGDIYSIFYGHELFPTHTVAPASYPIVKPKDIGRDVERKDMTDFFVQFMKTDQLGRISSLHLRLADLSPQGTKDPVCISVAGLASTAVDFSKTGIPVDLSKLPRAPSKSRPDFMASGPRIQLKSSSGLAVAEFSDSKYGLESEETGKVTFYESQKVLGKLFRAIDEKTFLKDLRQLSKVPIRGATRRNPRDLLQRVWQWIEGQARGYEWSLYLEAARHLRESYEENIWALMHEFASSPHHTPEELEVFVGALIDRDGKQTKRQKEYSADLKDRIERDVAHYVHAIKHKPRAEGEEVTEYEEELWALERSVACVAVAADFDQPLNHRNKKLRSWGWVAVSVCFQAMEQLNIIE